jgi:hypothetical protein
MRPMYSFAPRVYWYLAALVLLLPSAASAQGWTQPWSDPRDRPPRVDVSASIGLLAPTDWSDLVLLGSISSISGVFEQVLVRDLRVEPDTVYGATVTYWRAKYGARAHVGLSRSAVVFGARPPGLTEPAGSDDLVSVNVNTWFYDIRGAIGLVDYSPSRRVWPYVFVGLGGITYDLARTVSPPLLTFIEGSPTRSGGQGEIVIIDDGGRQFLLAIDELALETVFALNFGVGADFRIPLGAAGLGLRLELSDHLAHSPLGLRIRELSPFGALTSDSSIGFGEVHHLRLSAGLVVQLGR